VENVKPGAGRRDIARPPVSIVITTFNHTRFLGEAIESALRQTSPPCEVIVVDDGSTDDPASVVTRYPQVQLIRQINQGLAAARNTGWRAAGGRYVVFLDADDRLMPEALASNLKCFAERPECGFVYAGFRYIDVTGRHLGSPTPKLIGEDPYESFLRGNCVTMHATVMYRRECLAEVGGFDIALSRCEDYDLYLRLARHYAIAARVDCIAEYRQHDENMTRDIPRMLDTILLVMRRQRPYLRDHAQWKTALRAGMRDWKSIYVIAQGTQALAVVKASGLRQIPLRAMAKIFVRAPGTVAEIGCRWGLKRLGFDRAATRRRPIRLGDLRRLEPFSRNFGYDRGKPIDRRYIEDFLSHNTDDIRGRVLEIGDNTYTKRYGGNRVAVSDVLHVNPNNPQATLIGDLANGDHLLSEVFDCIVLTQTLHLIFDMRKAVATLHRILKPGGVLLATVPGVSSIDQGEWGSCWYWSLSPAALSGLLKERFSASNVRVRAYGNVLAALGFLHGLAENELRPTELDSYDPQYPLIVAARAVRQD
jgi:glycosyltransferase involved in cell wall biosynthesis